jgi:hypothetical protein
MRTGCNHPEELRLPEVFCWTKYGDEAGEPSQSILQRKEAERQRNGGVFLWGIGQSIRPSLMVLLQSTSSPYVVFSPIKSPAAIRDRSPGQVMLWCDAVGYDGAPFSFPTYSLVTSRGDGFSYRKHHFALVCESAAPIVRDTKPPPEIAIDSLRNLASGTALGSSQVTAVVRRNPCRDSGAAEYPVTATARLIYPYLIQLYNGVPVSPGGRLGDACGAQTDSAIESLLELRRANSSDITSQPLFQVNA